MRYLLIVLILFISIFFAYYYLQRTDNITVISGKMTNKSDYQPKDHLKIMTYNIHHGTGLDGRLNLHQIVEIIDKYNINIIGLNEVDQYMLRTNFINQVKFLADNLKLNYVYGPNLKRGVFGRYGNLLLTSYPVIKANNYLLPGSPKTEERGLLDVVLLLPDGKKIHVLVTHLALNYRVRKDQIKWIEKTY